MATKMTMQSLKGKEKLLQEEIDRFRGMQKGEIRLVCAIAGPTRLYTRYIRY